MMQNNNMQNKQYTISVTENAPLMEYLTKKLSDHSRTSLRSLIVHGQIWLNGTKMLTDREFPLKKGDKLEIRSSKTLLKKKKLIHSHMHVVHEDDDVMVVYKKEGFLTVGTEKDKINTVYHVLNKYMKSYGRDKRIYVVHRLDRETSGLLIFAKSQEVQETLQKNWTKMVPERSYLAIVTGTMPDKKGVIKSYLTEDKSLIMHASEKDNGGDYAELEYEVIQEKHPYTLVKLSLETGRKNQIRVQLKSVGCPIVGDKKYGSTYKTAGRVCLHAGMLHFVHPVTKKHHQFEAPMPVEFKKLMK